MLVLKLIKIKNLAGNQTPLEFSYEKPKIILSIDKWNYTKFKIYGMIKKTKQKNIWDNKIWDVKSKKKGVHGEKVNVFDW